MWGGGEIHTTGSLWTRTDILGQRQSGFDVDGLLDLAGPCSTMPLHPPPLPKVSPSGRTLWHGGGCRILPLERCFVIRTCYHYIVCMYALACDVSTAVVQVEAVAGYPPTWTRVRSKYGQPFLVLCRGGLAHNLPSNFDTDRMCNGSSRLPCHTVTKSIRSLLELDPATRFDYGQAKLSQSTVLSKALMKSDLKAPPPGDPVETLVPLHWVRPLFNSFFSRRLLLPLSFTRALSYRLLTPSFVR